MMVKQTLAGIILVLGLISLMTGKTEVCIFLSAMAIMIALDSADDHGTDSS